MNKIFHFTQKTIEKSGLIKILFSLIICFVTIGGLQAQTYKLKARVVGEGGSITPKQATLEKGRSQKFIIEPSFNYEVETLTDNNVDRTIFVEEEETFISITVNGKEKLIPNGTQIVYNIHYVEGNHNIIVRFKQKNSESQTFSLEASVIGGNGTITPSNKTVKIGDNQVFQIIPDTGYEIESLTDNNENIAIESILNFEYKLTDISAKHNITVKFKQSTSPISHYKLTASTEDENGSITPLSSIVSNNGEKLFEIAPKEGFEIKELTDNGNDKTKEISENNYKLTGIQEDHTIIVKFKAKEYKLEASVEGGIGEITPLSATVSVNGEQKFTIKPANNYILEKLTDNGQDMTSKVDSENNYNLTAINSYHKIIVKFKKDPFAESNSKSVKNLKVNSVGLDVTLTWDAPGIALEEGFEKGTTGDWTLIDNDGDGYNWNIENLTPYPNLEHPGFVALSASRFPGTANDPQETFLSPDNFLISPELNYNEESILSYFVYSIDPNNLDHYGVFTSTTGNLAADFISATPLIAENAPNKWTERTLTIPAGTKYIAFRHYNSHGKQILMIDDIKIKTITDDFKYSVYRDGTKIKDNLTETTYKDNDVATGYHKYCIEVNYPENINSDKECRETNIVQPTYFPVTNLKTDVKWLDVTLTWEAPNSELDFTYTITRNGTTIGANLTSTSLSDKNISIGTHNYCVTVNYPSGKNSTETCETAKVKAPDYAAITNFNIECSNGNATLSWTPPPVPFENTPIQEDFEKGANGWTSIDADNDQNKWTIAPFGPAQSHSGNHCVLSLSRIIPEILDWPFLAPDSQEGPLDPNNYFISPEINLVGKGVLTYWIASMHNFFTDHYGIFVSSKGKSIADFSSTPIFEEDATGAKKDDPIGAEWVKRTVELPAGTRYVAFRHFNSKNKLMLKLDDVTISGLNQNFTYTIYRDNMKIAGNTKRSTYIDKNVKVGEHEYCVEVNYPKGHISKKVCKKINIEDTSIEDIQNYKILINGGNACINFDIETLTELTIYDATGRLMTKTKKEGSSTDYYTPGMYLVYYTSGNIQNVVKVIVR